MYGCAGTGMGDCASSTSSWSNNDGFDFVSSFTYYLYIAIICAFLFLSLYLCLFLCLSLTCIANQYFYFFFLCKLFFDSSDLTISSLSLSCLCFSSLSLCLLFPSLSSSFFLPFLALCFPLYSALTWHCFVQLSCHLTLMTRHNPSNISFFFWQL